MQYNAAAPVANRVYCLPYGKISKLGRLKLRQVKSCLKNSYDWLRLLNLFNQLIKVEGVTGLWTQLPLVLPKRMVIDT